MSLTYPAIPKFYRALFVIMFCPFAVSAQLSIAFSPDKAGGCAPLPVNFTSQVSGASAAAVYSWDFGNGNKSDLPNPGAVFKNTGSFMVTLVVKDGNDSRSVTKQIDVTPAPAADFKISTTRGCAPLDVIFTATTTSGLVSNYTWDFGDGNVQQTAEAVSGHQYLNEQEPVISLTVSNSYGCSRTITRQNVVNVLKPVKATFNAVQAILCRETDPLQLVNTSTGPGTLTYLWNFGDGTTSTMQAPSHVFNKKGIYTVQLTTTSSEGCSIINTQDGYINVASFLTDFSVPTTLCTRPASVQFRSTSNPVPDNIAWTVDGVPEGFNYENLHVTFSKDGNHVIKLVNQFGSCLDSVTKVVVVNPAPAADGLVAELQPNCGLPVSCKFNYLNSNAIKWEWNFGIGSSDLVNSVEKSPTFAYMYDGTFYAWVNLVTAAGCSTREYKQIFVESFKVNIAATGGQTNCGPFDLGFRAIVTPSGDSIVSYRWYFGDGDSSTLPEPTHHYSVPGKYITSLIYETRSGCKGTQYRRDITVYSKPSAEFTTASQTICGNTPVSFNAVSPLPDQQYNWTINGNEYYGEASQQWIFSRDSTYTIGLVVTNYGGCTDTVIKKDFVTVRRPFTYFTAVENTCDGDRGVVSFSQESKGATSWRWDFGDGAATNLLVDTRKISHTYKATGAYNVTLFTTNGSCTVSESRMVYVLLKQRPKLVSTKSSVCADGEAPIEITNLEGSPMNPGSQNNYYVAGAVYNDGTPFLGTIENDYPNVDWGLHFRGKVKWFESGKTGLKVILYSYVLGCMDTTNLIPLATKGSLAGFQVVRNDVCYKTPITIQDTSKTNSKILSWQWNFGDGNTLTSDQGGTFNHAYAYPGEFNIQLSLKDSMGCTTQSYYQNHVAIVRGPKAEFIPSSSNPPITLPVSFYNTSHPGTSQDTEFKWSFGDGGTSSEYAPVHTYATPGQYTVRLVASSLSSGCADTMIQILTVKNFNPGFYFDTENIGSNNCPPVMVRFTNTSSGYTHFKWDFGDGFSVANLDYPAHIYDKPGRYYITLSLYGEGGLTATYIDSVVILQPAASIQIWPRNLCRGESANLSAISNEPISLLWDFGDGTLVQDSKDTMPHRYNTAGSYKPTLILLDADGCFHPAGAVDSIIVRANPVITLNPSLPRVCFGGSVQLSATGGTTFEWSSAAGLSNYTIASPLANPLLTTTYSVTIWDELGCKNMDSVTVTVITKEQLRISNDTAICFGNTVQLEAAGTNTYNWIGTTAGLSSTVSPSPTAAPVATTIYTVVGGDSDKCFSDTAQVMVRVLPLPTVSIPPVPEIYLGEAIRLSNATSPDVVKWNWSPADHLDCNDCPTPVSRPIAGMRYTLLVTNNVGCTASATVLVALKCNAAFVFIPAAFSPNNDGLNDLFSVKGISRVKHFVIYGRYGNLVHERRDFLTASREAAWDGNLKGVPQPAGAYAWFAEMECPTGGNFTQKGTVLLLR